MIINKLSWKVGGEAGDGILNAGLQMFAKTCLRGGLHVFATAEYPSLIRGGHNNLDVRVDEKEVFSHSRYCDLLVALNKDTIDKHLWRMNKGGGIIFDAELALDQRDFPEHVKLFPIPMLRIANENGGKIMRNTVALGASIALLDFDMEIFEGVIRDNFEAKKGDVIVEGNIKAARAGYDYVKKNFSGGFGFKLQKTERKNTLFMSGHESVSAGCIKAGCKYFSAYPMTPASSVMMNLAAQERNYSLVLKHTEDEIAAINQAIGAAFAGVRAATGTSGGGFALMSEGFGMACQAEVPLVVIESQRPGPGTGMATHTGQGDLRFMLHASTDEGPRIIIAPGDAEECFFLTIDAFNLAEKYQMPVIVMTDKFLGESYSTVQEFDTKHVKIERGKLLTDAEAEKQKDYLRYKYTSDHISPRAIPGQKNCMHVASSYEHDEEGNEREEEEFRINGHNKRFRKLELAAKEITGSKLYGPENADVTIVAWGSSKGPVLEGMKLLQGEGIKANYLHVTFISPFPQKIAETISNAKKTVLVEGNKTGLLGGLIKEETGLDIDHKILKYDGRPFAPEDVADGVKEIIKKNAKEIVFSMKGKVIV